MHQLACLERKNRRQRSRKVYGAACGLLIGTLLFSSACFAVQETLTAEQLQLIRDVEDQRIKIVEQVVGSVIAVYGPSRQGGGSGVIIDPSGIALTNHHVIEGAGMKGFGGLDDGVLYDWDLIGTDPGGDVAIIKLKGRDDFPYSPLGDSDSVKVGDWAIAMGNPFLLAHDQVPTVTLGVVSGIQRFQEGQGSNQLVYGNCIQIDSSINPGNSGGPLFDMQGYVIGINGRGSFRDRGRVNVGLGYAISVNQIKNFIPDLLATKIVEHGTLDAAFSDRQGKVICSTIDLDSPAAVAGLELGDELLEFEGHAISYSNQFKNLICTFPEDWPADLLIRKEDGTEKRINVRMFGLPYNFEPDEESGETPEAPEDPEGEDDEGPSIPPAAGEAAESLKKYLLSEPGVVVNPEVNAASTKFVLQQWRNSSVLDQATEPQVFTIVDDIKKDEQVIGQQTIHAATDGRFRIQHQRGDTQETFVFDGQKFWRLENDEAKPMDVVEAKINPVIAQAVALLATFQEVPLPQFGTLTLDGGDKANGQLCSRMLWLDEDDDWFYGWLSLFDQDGKTQVRLVKVASDKNCKKGSAGVMFDDYRDTSMGVVFPWQKSVIEGLQETVLWTAVTKKVTRGELNESQFSVPEDASE